MAIDEFLTLVKEILKFKLFQLKDTPVTVSSVLLLVIVLVFFVAISKFTRKMFLSRIFKHLRLDEGTIYTLSRVTHYVIMLIGALVAFQFVGIDLSGLMVIFGALSVGIGFGLQNLTSNFVSGLILLVERPIRVGDRVTIGDTEGDVVEINIRSTEIRSLNNISIIVPNSEFVSTQVINWSYGELKVRLDIDVGVSYGSDLDTVFKCLNLAAAETSEVLKTPAHEVLHRGFGDSSWDMRLRVWIADPKRHNYVRSEINCAIVRKFREHGVEIPFPQRDLHVRSPLPVPFTESSLGDTA
jgi:small-conductance mechanosensitive channel